MTIDRIGVIGGGAWGTALAHLAAQAGRTSLLWARDAIMVETINGNHENSRYLSGVQLDDRLRATTELSQVCETDAILLVVPAQAIRGIIDQLAPIVPKNVPLICCAKGLELTTGHLMSEVIEKSLPNHPVGCLSGPTFAAESVRGMPTAVTLAIADPKLGAAMAAAISTPTFRPYISDDVVGAEVGGALKNVLAIACGIAAGIGMGENTRAALITRGLAEAIRLATTLGGRSETLSGLAGLGDLAMTCASRQSRNFRFGEALGQEVPMDKILEEMGGVVEGRHTARAIIMRAAELAIELPICQAVDTVLNQGAGLRVTIDGLMRRPLRMEADR
jgi:glycerol-3-phosphate dehydrogenase (NAD(P)+)